MIAREAMGPVLDVSLALSKLRNETFDSNTFAAIGTHPRGAVVVGKAGERVVAVVS